VKSQWRSQLIDAKPITARPVDAEDRSTLGHLEGDLIVGPNSQVATLVDRRFRFLILVRLPSRHTTVVVPALIEAYARLESSLRRTLTWDHGMELAAHKALTAATGIGVYFADQRSPWQRGTYEDTVSVVPGPAGSGCQGEGRQLEVTLEILAAFGSAFRLTCPAGCRHLAHSSWLN